MRMYKHASSSGPRGSAGLEGYTAAVSLWRVLSRVRLWAIATAVVCLLTLAFSAESPKRSRGERTRDLKFAGEMARQGLWREALFRWERLLREEPKNAYLLNNVAVAKEALGDRAGAKEAYDRALAIAREPKLLANADLFTRSEQKPTDQPSEPGEPQAPKSPEAP